MARTCTPDKRFCPDRCLRSRKRLKLGGSGGEAVASLPGGGVFQLPAWRTDLSYRFRSVSAWISVTRMTEALEEGGWRRGWRAPSGL